ncbi:MAG: MarC family protein [Thermodesulfovibrionales bacterium]
MQYAELLRELALTFIPIFVAIDIFAVLPIFLGMTVDLAAPRLRSVIRESVLTALIVGLAFVGLGEALFSVLGITGNDFRIAGGIVLLVFAVLDLVRQMPAKKGLPPRFGVVPVGVPLIVGPAVLTTLLVLVEQHGIAVTVASFLLNLAIVWLALRKGRVVIRLLGEGGVLAVSKIMALLLASIAVRMIRIGIENILQG